MRIAIFMASIAILATGCADTYMDSRSQYPGFGNTVAHNKSVQIVDPTPAAAEDTVIPMNGAKAALAIERYESGKTVAPSPLRTGSGSGGGVMATQ